MWIEFAISFLIGVLLGGFCMWKFLMLGFKNLVKNGTVIVKGS